VVSGGVLLVVAGNRAWPKEKWRAFFFFLIRRGILFKE
jgi:hypothetical protein